ncbi:7TM diverse intracellular signaling domain-containing protein [Fulvivirga imtechensis]|nr:7TM diverse intracellular signaling domain-containing protein [Fulvivirga imtechensis]
MPARKGKLDISLVDFNQAGLVSLDGEWEFYWKQLLAPDDFKAFADPDPHYFAVPEVWNNKYAGLQELAPEGYATYRLLLLRNDSERQLLSLSIPNVYTNYKLWINGVILSSNGNVGTEASLAKPQWEPVIKTFEASGETIEIILQVSNFHHARGGVHKSLKLGTPEAISKDRETAVVANMLLVGGLLILGAFFLVFFLIRKGQRATMYFGALCLFWGIRSLFSNIYLVTSFFESTSWGLAVRVEYISLYLSMLWGMLFISSVFPNGMKALYKYILITINYCIISLTVILPPVFFTQLLPAYQFFIAVNLLYAVVVISRAIYEKQFEAWFSAASIIIGIGLFAYELTAYALVVKINLVFLNLGYLMIFFLNSLVLAYHFVGAYKQVHVLEKEKASSFERRLRRA